MAKITSEITGIRFIKEINILLLRIDFIVQAPEIIEHIIGLIIPIMCSFSY